MAALKELDQRAADHQFGAITEAIGLMAPSTIASRPSRAACGGG